MGRKTDFTRKRPSRIKCLILISMFVLALGPAKATAQQPEHYSKKQLRLLMTTASKADDFQKLATYFHYQALTYSSKAQKILEEYELYGARYPMATKTIPRAEMESKLYREYSAKADDNSELAARYDRILSGFGVKPESVSSTVVSAQDLEKPAKGTACAALVERPKTAGN